MSDRFSLLRPLVLFVLFATAALAAPAPERPTPGPVRLTDDDSLPAGALARLGTRRFRQADTIDGLGVSPDGRTLFTPSQHGLVHWDAATGRAMWTLPWHGSQSVYDLSFSADGTRVLVRGRADLERFVLDRRTGQTYFFRDHHCHSASLSPDGKTVALVEEVAGRYELRLRDVETGKLLRKAGDAVERKKSSVSPWSLRYTAFSPKGDCIARWFEGTAIRLCDVATGRCLKTLTGGSADVLICAFSSDGKRLVSGAADGSMRVWDVETSQQVRAFELDGPCGDVTFSPDGETIVAAHRVSDLLGEVVAWGAADGRRRWRYPALANHLTFSHGSSRLYAAGGHVIHVIDPRRGKPMHPVGHDGIVLALAFSSDGRELTSAGQFGQICRWDVSEGRLLDADRGHDGSVTIDLRHADRRLIRLDAVLGEKREVSLRTREVSGRVIGQRGPWRLDTLSRAVFPLDGRSAAVIPQGERARVIDLEGGSTRFELGSAEETVEHVSGSRDGRLLAVSLAGGPIRVLDAATGKERHRLGGRAASWFPRAIFSPDGAVLAEVSQIRRPPDDSFRVIVRVWDVKSGSELRQWEVPALGYHAPIAFGPDSRTLAVSNKDDGICLYDTTTGKERQRIQTRQGHVCALAFSPDGQALASGGWDTTVLLWAVGGRQGLGAR